VKNRILLAVLTIWIPLMPPVPQSPSSYEQQMTLNVAQGSPPVPAQFPVTVKLDPYLFKQRVSFYTQNGEKVNHMEEISGCNIP